MRRRGRETRARARVITRSIALAKAGLGVAGASWWMCRAELGAGDLVRVLPGFRLNHVDVHAVFPAGHRPSRKVSLRSHIVG